MSCSPIRLESIQTAGVRTTQDHSDVQTVTSQGTSFTLGVGGSFSDGETTGTIGLSANYNTQTISTDRVTVANGLRDHTLDETFSSGNLTTMGLHFSGNNVTFALVTDSHDAATGSHHLDEQFVDGTLDHLTEWTRRVIAVSPMVGTRYGPHYRLCPHERFAQRRCQRWRPVWFTSRGRSPFHAGRRSRPFHQPEHRRHALQLSRPSRRRSRRQ